jgi:hypothetical protein
MLYIELPTAFLEIYLRKLLVILYTTLWSICPLTSLIFSHNNFKERCLSPAWEYKCSMRVSKLCVSPSLACSSTARDSKEADFAVISECKVANHVRKLGTLFITSSLINKVT